MRYLSIRYTERLAEAGVQASVGGVGDSYDNALAEPINGTYKAELVHRKGLWRTCPHLGQLLLDGNDRHQSHLYDNSIASPALAPPGQSEL